MILCVLIPRILAAVERRAHPEWVNTPLIFLRHSGKQERVYAASADAEGVAPGQRVSQAQTICPEALLLPVEFHRAANVLRDLVERLRSYSEVLEVKDDFHEDLIVYLNLGKLKPSDGIILGESIRAVGAALQLTVSIGIAGGKFTAYVATQRGGIHLVRPGEEAAFLAPLPVSLLPLARPMERLLWLLGIERLGQFAALPKTAITAQFGRDGLALRKLATGQDDRAIRQYRLSNQLHFLRTFDEAPLDSREWVTLILDDMIHDLARSLLRSGSSTEEVSLILYLENHQSLEELLQFRRALTTEDELRRSLHRALERMEVTVRVTGIELACALRLAELPRQMSLFDYAEAQERKIEQEIKRLAERFGSQRFLRAVPDEHSHPLPERRYRGRAAGMTHLWLDGSPIKVWAETGRPKRLVWNETVYPVAEVCNHWRIDRGWWHLRIWRDCFKLQTSNGTLLDVYHDLLTDKWYVQRVYD